MPRSTAKKPPPASIALSELVPEGLASEGQGWQQRKSAQTRVAILEAAIDCLEKHGYARTTTQLIAETAGISRGAMLHHYATKQELIASVIDYAFYKRMEGFIDRVHGLTEEQRVHQNAGMEVYWQSILTREYMATLQLSVAARTDAELREILLPKHRKYDRVERETVLAAFPEWSSKAELFELSMDFCIASMEGLLLNRDVWDDRRRRVALRALISTVILMIREGQFTPPSPEAYLPNG